ncbi:MAG: papain-like cysteine protease family protein [Chloroflexota bacterium]
MSQRPGSGVRGLVLGLALLGLITVAAVGAVQTDTFGAKERFAGLVTRVRMFVAPPVDRQIEDVITIVDDSSMPPDDPGTDAGASAAPDPTPRPTRRPVADGDPVIAEESSAPEADPTPDPTPAVTLPPRKPVDFKLKVATANRFVSQVDNTMCAPAGLQMVLAMYGAVDTTDATQKQIDHRLPEWESKQDAHVGGWGPAAMVSALAAYGVPGYQLRAYDSRAFALRDAARIMTETQAPVILIAWRGAHTWVMTGYRADADPTIFKNATVTGTYIFDPWYPRISSIWGPSDGPGGFQDMSEMQRNFLPWQRPEGHYPPRDGKWIIVAPTISMKDARAALDNG